MSEPVTQVAPPRRDLHAVCTICHPVFKTQGEVHPNVAALCGFRRPDSRWHSPNGAITCVVCLDLMSTHICVTRNQP
jgi:hypothetical protein